MPVSYRMSSDRMSYEIVCNSQVVGNACRDQKTRRTFEFMPNDYGRSLGLEPSVHARMRDSPAGYGLLREIGKKFGEEPIKQREPWRYDPNWAKDLPPRPAGLPPRPGLWKTVLNWGVIRVSQTKSGTRYRYGYVEPSPHQGEWLLALIVVAIFLMVLMLAGGHNGWW
jgi:hypothetical protein